MAEEMGRIWLLSMKMLQHFQNLVSMCTLELLKLSFKFPQESIFFKVMKP